MNKRHKTRGCNVAEHIGTIVAGMMKNLRLGSCVKLSPETEEKVHDAIEKAYLAGRTKEFEVLSDVYLHNALKNLKTEA